MAYGKLPGNRKLREKNAQRRRRESESGAAVINKTVSTLNPSLNDILSSYEIQSNILNDLQEKRHRVTGEVFEQVRSHDDLVEGLAILEKGQRVRTENDKRKTEDAFLEKEVEDDTSVSELLDWYKEFESKNETVMRGFGRR